MLNLFTDQFTVEVLALARKKSVSFPKGYKPTQSPII